MSDEITAFFETLSSRGHEPLLTKADGSIRFELHDGDEVEYWFINVTKGDMVVSRENAEATCSVRAEKKLFESFTRGEANAMTAMLRGEAAIEGDPRIALSFERLLPGPSVSTHPRRRNAGEESAS